MQSLIFLALSFTAASTSFIGYPGAYPGAISYAPAYGVHPYYAPRSQHHSQDEFGNFNYGYQNINSQKSESGNAYDVVKGEYSYIDGYGKSQTVNYVADDYGFRASGTNLVNSADALNTGIRHKRSLAYPYAPAAYPTAAIASSQYRSQDEYDNFSFGYANANSQRQESGNAHGGVSGSYSYVDAYGKTHTVKYVADALGFRATGTDLVNSAFADRVYRKKRSIGYAPYYPVPLAYHHPAAPVFASSQYNSQDEYGNYNYGYANVNSQKSESGNARDVVKGSYSYVDGYGKSQTVNYVADGYGFRASGTNLVNSADAINTY